MRELESRRDNLGDLIVLVFFSLVVCGGLYLNARTEDLTLRVQEVEVRVQQLEDERTSIVSLADRILEVVE